jgi:type IV pilus assembly protein PilC
MFEALNNAGEEIKDEIEAQSTEDAISRIREMGYYPTRVKEKAAGRKKFAASVSKRKKRSITIGGVSFKALTMFTRQLSTLQDAGLPIVRCLRIHEGQMKPGVLRNSVMGVADDVEGGSTLSEAMAKYPKCFDRLYVNMVKAGEAGGVLDTILQRLAEFREKSMKLRKKIIGAMIYPVVVITIAVTILGVIMVYIIPKFEEMFAEFEIQLPAPTLFLISVSRNVRSWIWFVVFGPIGLFILYKLVRKSRGGRYVTDKAKLKMPLFGLIVNKSTISRFCRTLGTLITSGVPILEALNIVKDTAGNEVVARAIGKVHDSIREGETIAEPLRQSKVCDEIVVNMIDVGEETGDLDKMLIKVADNYDDDVDTLVASMVSLLEPLLIIFLGVTVGFIVISLFLPLVELMKGLGK